MSITSAGRFVLDIIYPPECALCSRGGSFLCSTCDLSLAKAAGERCPHCWLPTSNPHCETELAFDSLRSAYRFTGQVRDLIHAFKFRRLHSLAEPLGGTIATLIERHDMDVDALVPVPMLPMRERHRGFNQTVLLAREAAKHTGLIVHDVLERRGNAEPQNQAATAEQRRQNVIGAYSMRKGADVRGQRLLLVDDIATTGATLDACARVLLDAGAASVSAVTLARED